LLSLSRCPRYLHFCPMCAGTGRVNTRRMRLSFGAQASQLQAAYVQLLDEKRVAMEAEAAARSRAADAEAECQQLSARLRSLSSRLAWRAAEEGQRDSKGAAGCVVVRGCGGARVRGCGGAGVRGCGGAGVRGFGGAGVRGCRGAGVLASEFHWSSHPSRLVRVSPRVP
jgi:hypothetical protein